MTKTKKDNVVGWRKIDHPIPVNKTDPQLICKNKRALNLVDFGVRAGHTVKLKDLASELKNFLEHGGSITTHHWNPWNSPQESEKQNKRKTWNHPDHISQNPAD